MGFRSDPIRTRNPVKTWGRINKDQETVCLKKVENKLEYGVPYPFQMNINFCENVMKYIGMQSISFDFKKARETTDIVCILYAL